MTEEVTDELVQLYSEIYEDGFFIKEFIGLAGVGDLRDLEWLAEQDHLSLSEAVELITMGVLVDLTIPGTGTTRVERVRDAWEQAKQLRNTRYLPRLKAVRDKLGMLTVDPKPLGTF